MKSLAWIFYPIPLFAIGAALYFGLGLSDAFIQWWCGLTVLSFFAIFGFLLIRNAIRGNKPKRK